MNEREPVRIVLFDAWGTLFYNEVGGERTAPFDVLADTLGWAPNSTFLRAYEEAFMLEPHEAYDPPIRRLSDDLGVELGEDDIEAASEHLRELDENVRAYDGALDAVERVQSAGHRVGLVTNTGTPNVRALRHEFDIGERFDAVVPSCTVGALKPDAAIFDAALTELGVTGDAAVMVGDTVAHDCRGARAAGLRTGILVDRDGEHPGYEPRIESLGLLPAAVPN